MCTKIIADLEGQSYPPSTSESVAIAMYSLPLVFSIIYVKKTLLSHHQL